ncbi:cyclin N-terminal domain-containing protein 1 isoform X2 [Petaurus breviceps papuanus]|uniref:cyclin N-terminal domain-containing protein 1 isoform X2 n=1 Tax=Petaurus breviceps papuanus TaxID=3040969 RepID=UPI0036DCCA3E
MAGVVGRRGSASLIDFKFGAVDTQTIEDALLHLAQENERAVREARGQAGSFRETRIVEFVFLLSEQWCLEKSVSYQAVEILERFMVKQAESICNQPVTVVRGNEKAESWNWRAQKEELCNMFVLRLVSCVQLASKLSFHYKIVSNVTVLNFLQALGYLYTKEELLESELAILKSLNFQINLPTPLAYVEMLLEVLGRNKGRTSTLSMPHPGYNGCLVSAKQLHGTCLTLLDLVYLLHEPIYESLLRASTTPMEQGRKYVSVKEDFMLLAVGIIAASAFIQNQEWWGQVVEHLHSITGIATESIAEFSHAILTHGVGASTPIRQQPGLHHLAARPLRAAATCNM